MVIGSGETIHSDDLPLHVENGGAVEPVARSLAAVEKEPITRVLDDLDGNVSQAAKVLGIDRATLYNKIKRYGVRRGQ
jgi:transcriptional regulator of acetoin/glycerol metabolism